MLLVDTAVKKMNRTYSELMRISSFEDRFKYLELHGSTSDMTFGNDRYLNQRFYRSNEWKRVRDLVVVRDLGLDLGCEGHEIYGPIYIHHMNPITVDDLSLNSDLVFDPEYLISVSLQTHNAIHYGDGAYLASSFVERKPGDTCPWKTGT